MQLPSVYFEFSVITKPMLFMCFEPFIQLNRFSDCQRVPGWTIWLLKGTGRNITVHNKFSRLKRKIIMHTHCPGVCGPKGNGFSAVLVINLVRVLKSGPYTPWPNSSGSTSPPGWYHIHQRYSLTISDSCVFKFLLCSVDGRGGGFIVANF